MCFYEKVKAKFYNVLFWIFISIVCTKICGVYVKTHIANFKRRILNIFKKNFLEIDIIFL